MDIDRLELIDALAKLKPGIASKEFLEQSTHFILAKEEIISYNDEISISCPFDIGVECTVDAGLLYKLINKMEDTTISVNLNKSVLKLECGGVKAELPTVTNSEIFEYINKLGEEQESLEWHPIPKDFLDAIRLCSFSASNDKTLGTLTCVWVEGEDVLSCDKYRVSWYKMESSVNQNFYIEAAYISELLNFDTPTEYCLSKSWAHFQLPNGIIFSTRLTNPDKLLPLRSKFEDFQHTVRIPLPDELKDTIETVSIAVEQKEKLDQLVTIEFGEDLIRCIGKSERGTITKEINLEKPMKIDPFSIQTSPRSLIEVLDKATHLLVGNNKGLFKSREQKGFQHLLGLIMGDE